MKRYLLVILLATVMSISAMERLSDQPQLAMLQSLLGIPREKDREANIHKLSQVLKRPDGTERWELRKKFMLSAADEELVRGIFVDLGFLREDLPEQERFDVACVFGATVGTMRNRISYLVKMWKQGIRFGTVVLLGGARVLNPAADIDPICDDAAVKTEADALKKLWEIIDMPAELRDSVSVLLINEPYHDNQRPTTEDTVKAMLALLISGKSYLFVSSQPTVRYQERVARWLMPLKYTVVTVGPATENNEKVSLELLCDTLARCLFFELKMSDDHFVAKKTA